MKQVAQIVAMVVVALVAIVALAGAVGWALPVGHTASVSLGVSVPPQQVYDLVADVAAYPAWWPEVSSVEVLPREGGRSRFRQHTGSGPLVIEVVDAAAPTRFVTRIADPDQAFGGTWTTTIEPAGSGGSRVTVTERGEIYSPWFRVLSRFVFGYTASLESFLGALGQRLAG